MTDKSQKPEQPVEEPEQPIQEPEKDKNPDPEPQGGTVVPP